MTYILNISKYFVPAWNRFNEDNKSGCHINLTKWKKNKEKIKDHEGDLRNGIESTALAKIAQNKNFNINYNKTKKLTI